MRTTPVYTYKKLSYLYTVHETFTAGIMLEGWEVKALMAHCGNIDTAYCGFRGKDFCMLGSKITPLHNHTLDDTVSRKEARDRVLLLNGRELDKIKDMLQVRGNTCVPARLYVNGNHLWKLDIAIVKGKNLFDKRETLRARDVERQMRRES
jgi:SsrA-binding protein